MENVRNGVGENSDSLKQIKELAAANKIERIDEEYLSRFLTGHQNNVSVALNALRNFQSFLNRRRERWLKLEKSRVEIVLESQIVDVLDKKGLHDQKVVWLRVEKWNPQKFTADEILEISGLLCELAYTETREIKSIEVIIDLHNLSLRHLHGLSRKFAKRMVFFMTVKMFYDLLEEYPDWFAMGSPLEKKAIIEQNVRLPTHIYDKEGRPVYIVKLENMNSMTMDLVNDIVPVDDYFMEFLLLSDPKAKNGLSIIIDVANFGWNLMTWLTPHNMNLIVRRVQTIPVKAFRFHLVNKSMLIYAAINVVWPFLSQHVRDTIKFHFDDWNSLHEYIDPDVLPLEYGGKNNLDYTKYRDEIYSKNEEIADSFRINRELYLKNLDKDICKH